MNEDKSYLKGLDFILCGHKHYLIDKFSGFQDIDVDLKSTNFSTYILIYNFECYFSGNTLTLERKIEIPLLLEGEIKKNIFGFEYKTSVRNPAFDFLKKGDFWNRFKKSDWKPIASPTSVTSDYIRWIAENTNTNEELNDLRKEVKLVFSLIDEHNQKVKDRSLC